MNIGDVWISIKNIEYSQKIFNLNNVIIRYCQKFCANTQVKWNGVNQISINSYQTLFKTFIASLIMLVIIIFNRGTKWCSKPPLLGKEPSFSFFFTEEFNEGDGVNTAPNLMKKLIEDFLVFSYRRATLY